MHKHVTQGVRRGKYKQQWLHHHSPIKPRSKDKTWFDEHEWVPILSKNYSTDVEKGCEYPHYFDATRDILDSIEQYHGRDKCGSCYTALTYGLFHPTSYYTDGEHIYIVFDSGYTTFVTSHREDFVGKLKEIKKLCKD